jgi:3'(2'), 5'-bisphosphate nucleotidase
MSIAPDLTAPALLDALTSIASAAAAEIVRIGAANRRIKVDASVVTDADEASETVICRELIRILPGVTIVSEESSGAIEHDLTGTFLLVDPLDGTREFVDGRDEYTVNIAIVHDGRPVAGVVGAPAAGIIWRGAAGKGSERLNLIPGAPASAASERTQLHVREPVPDRLIALVSRSHLDAATAAFIDRIGARTTMCGSAVKFCRIAEGAADVYPRLAPVMEWDAAAGDAVLSAAGGAVLTPEGELLHYGRRDNKLRIPAFIAWGSKTAVRTPR